MTKTVAQLRAGVTDIERMACGIVDASPHPAATMGGVITGLAVAKANIELAILDLAIKGVLPEGSSGRIIRALGEVLRQAEARIHDGTQAKVPGVELPSAG